VAADARRDGRRWRGQRRHGRGGLGRRPLRADRRAGGAYALVLLTTWDTPADATEFAAAATQAVVGVPGEARVVRVASGAPVPGGAEVAVLFASDASVLERLAAAALP